MVASHVRYLAGEDSAGLGAVLAQSNAISVQDLLGQVGVEILECGLATKLSLSKSDRSKT
jgi:hypothetical protein